jgi:hypothetical protein
VLRGSTFAKYYDLLRPSLRQQTPQQIPTLPERILDLSKIAIPLFDHVYQRSIPDSLNRNRAPAPDVWRQVVTLGTRGVPTMLWPLSGTLAFLAYRSNETGGLDSAYPFLDCHRKSFNSLDAS